MTPATCPECHGQGCRYCGGGRCVPVDVLKAALDTFPDKVPAPKPACPTCGDDRQVRDGHSFGLIPCPQCRPGYEMASDEDLLEDRLRREVERLENKLSAVAAYVDGWRKTGFATTALDAIERIVTDSGRKALEAKP